MKNKALLIILILFSILSCRREIKPTQGAIDIYSNIYFNASKGLDDYKSYHVSRLNFRNDTIIELIPDLDIPEYNAAAYLIVDSTYYDLGEFPEAFNSDFRKLTNPKLVYEKEMGAVFTHKWLPNYEHKKILKDTVLFGKHYLRFEIKSPESFTRYYVHPTDTILPYTIYGQVKKKFKGRIERVDSYDRVNDIFVTLQMVVRDSLDKEALDIFDYNKFILNKK